MAGPPLIGITTYGRGADGRFQLPAAYVDAVRRAGGVPVLLPPGEAQLETLLARLDGLILSGGGDIDPRLYDGMPHAEIERVDAERDAMELSLARQVVARDLPALCICRGAQVLNVALGGNLVEHLPDEVGVEVTHRPASRGPDVPYPRHPVSAEPGSLLARVMGSTEVVPASWHHQAPRRVAPGLAVVARAPDGTVEALEGSDRSWLVAVQWHPEETAGEDPSQQRLFDELVAAAARRREPGGKSRADDAGTEEPRAEDARATAGSAEEGRR
jgi:putative glutamine amidotransferase